jgi:hypothetical protein
MRHRNVIGLSILALGIGLGVATALVAYVYGQAIPVRVGIPGAVLLMSVGALMVW